MRLNSNNENGTRMHTDLINSPVSMVCVIDDVT